MKYDIKQFFDWPLSFRAGAIAIACLIVFYLGYMFDLSSSMNQLNAIKHQEQEFKDQLLSLANSMQDINSDLTKYPALTDALAQTQKKLISHSDLPELLNEILKIGSQNQLEIVNFTPGSTEQEGTHTKVVIKLIANGTFDQISNFISQIANMEKIVAIDDFTISTINADKSAAETPINRLNADITLEIYEAK